MSWRDMVSWSVVLLIVVLTVAFLILDLTIVSHLIVVYGAAFFCHGLAIAFLILDSLVVSRSSPSLFFSVPRLSSSSFASFLIVVLIVRFLFLILILILVLRGEGRKPRSDLAAFCLILLFLHHFTVDFVQGDAWA
ncbi:hypothetical protein P692DRAFT_20883327 [Suillus brevipes Sb2]|nr:hypothetical protein P692DRAFT_20883327 [Suillus brevipes Sb2]